MCVYELDALDVAIDKIGALNPAELDADAMREVVVRLARAQTRLAAVSAGMLATFDANGDWAGSGCYSAANWIKNHTRSGRAETVSRVRLAHRLQSMPVTAAAFTSAEITEAHVRSLARCLGPRTRWAFPDAEDDLVGHARRLDADQFAKLVDHWIDVVDEDGAMPKLERPDELHAAQTLAGRIVGKFNLSRELGVPFLEILSAKVDELFQRDKKLREVDPTDPLYDSMPAERRARALVELVEQGHAAHDPTRRQAAFTIIIDEQTAAGHDAGANAVHESMSGSTVPLPSLYTWLCDSHVARLVMSAEGVPLDLGREQRTVSRRQRRALFARDRGCAVPGCDRTPNWCDAHHIEHWIRGGRTDLDNLVLLCRHHHRRIHAGRLDVRVIDGRPQFFLPTGTELAGVAQARAAPAY